MNQKAGFFQPFLFFSILHFIVFLFIFAWYFKLYFMKNVAYLLFTLIFVSCSMVEKNQQDLTKRLRGTDWTHGDYYYKQNDGVYKKSNEKVDACVMNNILRFDADSVLMEDAGIKCAAPTNWGKKYAYKLSSDNRSLDILIPNSPLNYKVEAYNDAELNLSLKSDPNGVIFYKRLKDFK